MHQPASLHALNSACLKAKDPQKGWLLTGTLKEELSFFQKVKERVGIPDQRQAYA